jgi:hypothetical protein
VIPDAAVDAAHKAWREQAKLDGSIFEYNLRAALEAAAPHIAAQAWDEGMEAMYATTSSEWPPIAEQNPYRNPVTNQ